MLNGHLRKANAEIVTLKNQLELERDKFTKRASDLKRAMDEHCRCSEEALKARRDMEASTRDTLATTKTHIAVATRQHKQAENIARDLKVRVPTSSTGQTIPLVLFAFSQGSLPQAIWNKAASKQSSHHRWRTDGRRKH